jgi:S1-C subfamily serine protease
VRGERGGTATNPRGPISHLGGTSTALDPGDRRLFLRVFALLVYCEIVRPINPGFRADSTKPGAVVLIEVRPGTPAADAGLVGDRLIAINRLVIVDSDSWGAIGANYEIDTGCRSSSSATVRAWT